MKVFSIKRLTLGAALCIPLASAWGQAATATQQYLGAPLPDPVMAVERSALGAQPFNGLPQAGQAK